ncbi:MAG: hypothetical protein AAB225_04480 [Acidobacteriota bacterium]
MQTRLLKLVVGALAVSVALWAADPLLGTWKLNLEKSKYGARPAPKSSIATFAAQEGGMIKYTADAVDAKGEAMHMEWSAKLDGKDYPVIGSPMADTVVGKRINARTMEWTVKKEGKVAVTGKSVISRDGKTLTAVWNGTDEKGQPQSWTAVSERQ